MTVHEKQAAKNLVEKQRQYFPMVIDDLIANHRKKEHWAWWVWPTEKKGSNEPGKKSFITMNTVSYVMHNTDTDSWIKIMEILNYLLKNKSVNIIPKRDHLRIKFFCKFFKEVMIKDKEENFISIDKIKKRTFFNHINKLCKYF